MKKGIILSFALASALLASPNETKVKTYGLYFGNIANAKEEASVNDYGRENAFLGCLHNRGGSDTIGYADCTELTQIYADNSKQTVDAKKFRDNVWCMESSNSSLGTNETPNAKTFSSDINNNSNITNLSNENNYKYNTSIYKYSDGYYQESYKNLSVNTTGKLLIIAKNENKNPFSFYITANNYLHNDVRRFANEYVGVLNGRMYGEYIKPYDYINKTYKLTGKYQGWIGLLNASRNDGGTESNINGCNAAITYGAGFKKGGLGCGVSEWGRLSQIEKYVRFYYGLSKQGCSIRPVNLWDYTNPDQWLMEDTARYNGVPLYGGIIDDDKNILYYRTLGSATNGQVDIDKAHVKRARAFDLSKVITNDSCKQAVEAISVKNIATYGLDFTNHIPNDLKEPSKEWKFLNQKLENDSYFGNSVGFSQNIGKCYFVNLQYNDRKYSDSNYTAFKAFDAYKFFWNEENRFLQNYLPAKDNEYAIANYSIDRSKGYYKSKYYGENHNFSLHTRPTSFKDEDVKDFGNTKDGKLDAKYYISFYPDANGSEITKIDESYPLDKYKVKNLPSEMDSEYYLVTSAKEGEYNNVQLAFKLNDDVLDVNRLSYANKAKCNLSNGFECDNYKFAFNNFEYKLYKLNKEGNEYTYTGVSSEGKASVGSDIMALRVNDDLLTAVNYNSDEIVLLEITINKAVYEEDNRPFYEYNSNDIISAKNPAKFFVIVERVKFNKQGLSFGSIWDKANPSQIPVLNSSNTGFSVDSAYTRVVGNPVYLGIEYTQSTNEINSSDSFITYHLFDENNNELDDENISMYENGLNLIPTDTSNYDLMQSFNDSSFKYSRPFYNGVLKIDNLKVGRYKVCFNIYSKDMLNRIKYDNPEDAKIKAKASGCTNLFSIRPAYIDYSTSSKFSAGENAKNGGKKTNFNVKILDLYNQKINTNYSFALSKAKLLVNDSKLKPYDFSLYFNDEKISLSNMIDFKNLGNMAYLIEGVVVNFPFSTDAKLELFEGKFTKLDNDGNYCIGDKAYNVIQEDGRVGCLISSKSPLNINFESDKDYKIGEIKLNNPYTKAKVFFKSFASDDNSLKIPFVFNDKGKDSANGLEYVYNKFSDDHILNYKLNFANKDDQAANRYYVDLKSPYIEDEFSVSANKNHLNIKDVKASKEKLNKLFDEKLEEFYNASNKSSANIDTKLFEAKKDEILIDLNLAYLKHKKTLDNKYISSINIDHPKVSELILLSNSSIEENSNINNLDKDYSFIFTALAYKDAKIKGATTITLDPNKDLEIFYVNTKGENVKIIPNSDIYTKSKAEIAKHLNMNANYSSSISKNNSGELIITLTPSNSKKEYIKELINIANTNDFNGGIFSVEFRH